MRRVVVWGWHRPGEVRAIQTVAANKGIEIIAWFGSARECTHNLDQVLHQFRIESDSYSGAATDIYDEVYRSLPEFLELYSRVSFSLARSFHELIHIFNVYVDYFAHLLRHNRIDLVLLSNLPHFGVDYLLYAVARALGIRTIMCNQSLIPNRFFYTDDVEDFGYFRRTPEDMSLPYQPVAKKFEKELFYVGKFRRPFTSCHASLVNDMVHSLFLKKSKPMTLAGVFQKYQNSLEYKQWYPVAEQHSVDFGADYVYFPLQMQPELTTSILGGKYADQLLALERVASLIPNHWKIYVKENPKQTRRQREALFFQRLARIRKAVYLVPAINTYDLLRNCRFVATVTGTVGWEAVTGGKPVLVFGKAWYRTLPGVFEYEAAPTIEEILSCTIDHNQVEEQYNRIMRKTGIGVVDPDYNVLVKDFSHETNARFLVEFINSVC